MEKELKLSKLNECFNQLKQEGRVSTKKEFAILLGVNYIGLTQAFNGNEQNLTDKLIAKVVNICNNDVSPVSKDSIPLIPIDSVGGFLTEFNADGVTPSQCEYITTPIKGATMAIRIIGDSMTPDYPNGSTIFIKKIQEDIFIEWGNPYVLDTENGVVCKIVQPCDDNDNIIECQSINPLYKPFKVAKKYIRGWYRVLMVMALK